MVCPCGVPSSLTAQILLKGRIGCHATGNPRVRACGTIIILCSVATLLQIKNRCWGTLLTDFLSTARCQALNKTLIILSMHATAAHSQMAPTATTCALYSRSMEMQRREILQEGRERTGIIF